MSKLTKALTAAAGNAGAGALYVEDVFSTYLYEGNGFYPSGGGQTITNGIDLDGEGGMIWIKARNTDSSHGIYDTERGISQMLGSNLTAQEYTDNAMVSANSDGFTLGAESSGWTRINLNGYDYASWTFRKAEKFFDVVTYTGDGVNGRQLPHNLGSTPGMVVCKRTDTGQNWILQHRSLDLSGNKTMYLNLTDPLAVANDYWNSTHASDTAITLSGNADINGIGGTYVAYVFAHDAGGFGDDGDESIIKCGSYTGTGSGGTPPVIDLGFEPQWLLTKQVSAGTAGNWMLMDTMRGWGADGSDLGPEELKPNTSDAEFDWGQYGYDLWTVNPTGFTVGPTDLYNVNNQSGVEYIYIAIRRPMKTPESGTEVFAVNNGDGVTVPGFTSGFPVDMAWERRVNNTDDTQLSTRLLGETALKTNTTDAEASSGGRSFDYMDGWFGFAEGVDWYSWMFKRATGFFDVVAYTGDGVASKTVAHNLGVAPELVIIKSRSYSGSSWLVFHKDVCTSGNQLLLLQDTSALLTTGSYFPNGFSSSSTTTSLNNIGSATSINRSDETYIAYLFATLDGVSKVGSYTGDGTTDGSNVIDCGFSAGARFVLIKRTDSTGSWLYMDSVRGITSSNDPILKLNSGGTEQLGNSVHPAASGFGVVEAGGSNANTNGANYIFLAIA